MGGREREKQEEGIGEGGEGRQVIIYCHFVDFRHKRHLSDPSYSDIYHATPTTTSLHLRPSASVGVSPAQNLPRTEDREERKRQKLAQSIEKEKELSQR